MLFQDSLIKFGERVAAIRRMNGLTQTEVAEDLGITDSTVSRMERGECLPPRYMLQAMFQLYNMSPEDSLSMLLDGGEYYEDDIFNELLGAIRKEDLTKVKRIRGLIDEKKLAGKRMHRQLYLYAGIVSDHEEDARIRVGRMIEALRLTKKGFRLECIPKLRFHFEELMIVNGIGKCYLGAGELQAAAKIFEDMIESMDTFYFNERLKCEVYPDFLYNLSICYGGMSRHNDAERVCMTARELAVMHREYSTLPRRRKFIKSIDSVNMLWYSIIAASCGFESGGLPPTLQ
jgi:transcriptional regulator with XRE-family HTH domain